MRLEYLEILPRKKMTSPPPYIVQIVDWNTQHQTLATLCDAAKQRGFGEVMLHAQTHAAPFYYQHGFLSLGSEFFEAGIPHQEMHKRL